MRVEDMKLDGNAIGGALFEIFGTDITAATGVCDSCGQEIAPRRLEAMPDSTLCVQCAAAEAPALPPRRR